MLPRKRPARVRNSGLPKLASFLVFLNFGLIKINGVICKLPDLYHFQVPYGHEPERTEIKNKYNNIRFFLLYPLLVD